MTAPNVKRCLALVVLAGSVLTLLSGECLAQLAYPPYGALRGRMVDRNGLLNVTRYRWGNGVTPQGAAMITDLGQAFAPMIPLLVTGGVGRGVDDGMNDGQSRSVSARSPVQFTAPADYVEEQRRANNLLERTAALVNAGTGVQTGGPVPPPQQSQPAGEASIDELLKRYGGGTNPWKSN